jgi:signal transduction histidine kinase
MVEAQVMDLAVGVTFLVAAAAPVGAVRQRVVVAAVGVSWLLESVVTGVLSVHHGLLLLTLVTFPTGKVRGRLGWLAVALAVSAAVGLTSQLGIAMLYAVAAVVMLIRPATHWYPVVSAAAVAAVLGTAWTWSRQDGPFDPALALLSYEVVLLVIAISYPVAAWTVERARRRLADEALAGTPAAGLSGFASILADTLDDRALRVHRRVGKGYATSDGQAIEPQPGWLVVDGDDGPLAVVEHRSPALADAVTAQAVASAVRLAVTNARLHDEQLVRLAELEAARARVVAATDAQRIEMAEDLRDNVLRLLTEARNELEPTRISSLRLVDGSIATAITEIQDLVAGVPPARLGNGLLRSALVSLAQDTPADVTVSCAEDAAAGTAVESALYYVCSEALANAIKHADATRISIELSGSSGELRLVVADNGRGGAAASGSGLTGLADRLAAYSGRLQVVSPPGAGTTVTATVPVS